MHLKFRNINDAFRDVVSQINDGRISCSKSDSRNGSVLRCNDVITLTFTNPLERVLFNRSRDVNPFSLLYESLWTIAGYNTVAPIAYYTKRMVDYSDDGKTWHGAYGHRWRSHFGIDQLKSAIEQLRTTPTSRRVVLEMWDPRVDGVGTGKDYPCNTHIYLSIRDNKLDLTVCNRSNDLVWGLFGTNYVVFSFLLEYLASAIGISVGVYNHFTNNLHVYESNWKPKEWLGSKIEGEICYPPDFAKPYQMIPLVKDPAIFEKELPSFVGNAYGEGVIPTTSRDWQEPFFRGVAGPLLRAYAWHRKGDTKQALSTMESVASDDWRIAGTNWLTKRSKK